MENVILHRGRAQMPTLPTKCLLRYGERFPSPCYDINDTNTVTELCEFVPRLNCLNPAFFGVSVL